MYTYELQFRSFFVLLNLDRFLDKPEQFSAIQCYLVQDLLVVNRVEQMNGIHGQKTELRNNVPHSIMRIPPPIILLLHPSQQPFSYVCYRKSCASHSRLSEDFLFCAQRSP